MVIGFTAVFMFLGYTLVGLFIAGIDARFDWLDGNFLAIWTFPWSFRTIQTIVGCCLLSLWPFIAGMVRKSSAAAIVAAVAAVFVRLFIIASNASPFETLPQVLLLTAITTAGLAYIFKNKINAFR